jgi:hypothetical protein
VMKMRHTAPAATKNAKTTSAKVAVAVKKRVILTTIVTTLQTNSFVTQMKISLQL